MTGHHIITTNDEFDDLVDTLLDEPRYALDTEFHRERTYWPKVALVQIAWADQLVLVDPLEVDLAPFAKVLDTDATAVLHASSQDLEVLELACGTGLITLRAAAAVQPGGRVLATDIAGEMVSRTAARAAAAGFANVETLRMDAERLEVEDSAFDAALCALGLMYMPNPVAALAEMRRAVKARGRVAVAVWGERRHCGWAEIFPIVDARVQSEVCPLFFQLGAPGALAAASRAMMT